MGEAMTESLCSMKFRESGSESIGDFNTDISNMMRKNLKEQEKIARSYIDYLKGRNAKGESIAQATLAMRHIEDARMRYGKVIQYLGDGVSKFDK